MIKLNHQDNKLLIALTIGSTFEIFDFLAFVFLSSIIAKLFFPYPKNHLAILFTYLTISISYLLRPIGGLVLGHLGDTYGRKTAFTLSILLMSVPSFVIGLLPTFNQIGNLATILLIIARVFQGFSLGGEVPGSITYIAEKFKDKNYFFYCSWLTFGANMGVFLGCQTIRCLDNFSSLHFMNTLGWRIPFLIGGLLTIIGFYIRQSVSESKQFKQLQYKKKVSNIPLLVLIKHFKLPIIAGLFLSIIVSLTTSVFQVFLPNLFITYFHFNLNIAATVSTLGASLMAIFSVIFAYLTWYIKPIVLLRCGLLGLIVIFNLMLIHLSLPPTTKGLYLSVESISIALAMINGIFFGILASLFPTNVRFSGISICYNFAYILGAGLTPLWASSILQLTGSYKLIITICLTMAILSLINTLLVEKLTIKKQLIIN